ncbi:MAG: ribosome-recycling factor, partial [bacterium]
MLEAIFEETEEKMNKAISSVKDDFNSVRTGRATPSMFEGVTVDYYGSETPINQLAKIQIPEAKQVIIKPYDPGSIEEIEKGILDSDLDLTPNSDGEII